MKPTETTRKLSKYQPIKTSLQKYPDWKKIVLNSKFFLFEEAKSLGSVSASPTTFFEFNSESKKVAEHFMTHLWEKTSNRRAILTDQKSKDAGSLTQREQQPACISFVPFNILRSGTTPKRFCLVAISGKQMRRTAKELMAVLKANAELLNSMKDNPVNFIVVDTPNPEFQYLIDGISTEIATKTPELPESTPTGLTPSQRRRNGQRQKEMFEKAVPTPQIDAKNTAKLSEDWHCSEFSASGFLFNVIAKGRDKVQILGWSNYSIYPYLPDGIYGQKASSHVEGNDSSITSFTKVKDRNGAAVSITIKDHSYLLFPKHCCQDCRSRKDSVLLAFLAAQKQGIEPLGAISPLADRAIWQEASLLELNSLLEEKAETEETQELMETFEEQKLDDWAVSDFSQFELASPTFFSVKVTVMPREPEKKIETTTESLIDAPDKPAVKSRRTKPKSNKNAASSPDISQEDIKETAHPLPEPIVIKESSEMPPVNTSGWGGTVWSFFSSCMSSCRSISCSCCRKKPSHKLDERLSDTTLS